MITPQTYNILLHTYIHTYKTASYTLCILGSLRLAPNYDVITVAITILFNRSIYPVRSIIGGLAMELSAVNPIPKRGA
jgi:hypothetical protein